MQPKRTTPQPRVALQCTQCHRDFTRVYRDYARAASDVRCCSVACRRAYSAAQNGPCIYAIVHLTTGQLYIGSTTHRLDRWGNHRRELTAGRHANAALQALWQTCGADAFEFRVLAIPSEQQALVDLEQRCLDLYRDTGLLLNQHPNAGTARGFQMPAPAVAKIAAAHRGSKRSMETRAKIAAKARRRAK
jgi:predicted GIY-YIG superfamily endonuclease